MDNVTHSLVGILAAEAVAQGRRKPRLPLWIVSAVANNLPDLDVLLTTFVFPGKLGYLLHHRGHTHTLLLAPLLSLSLLLAAWWAWRKRTDLPWKEMAFLAILGGFLHIFADFWNSYGVHPFWPFDNRWRYGDFVFIVEPWIWVAVLPMVFWGASSRWGRATAGVLLAVILGVAWYHNFVPWPAATALTLAAGGLLWWMRERTARARVLVSGGIFLALLAGLAGLESHVRGALARPGQELALNPSPGNPLCWVALEAGHDQITYEASISVFAPFPGLVKATDCRDPVENTSAPLVAKPSPDPASRRYLGAFRAPWAELTALRRDCRVSALLQFARIPYWKRTAEIWVVGDLRYDRDSEISFAEIPLLPGEPCPKHLPPWRAAFSAEG